MLVIRCCSWAQNFRSEVQFCLLNQGGFAFVPQFCWKGDYIYPVECPFCIHKFCGEVSDVPVAEQCHAVSGVYHVNPSNPFAILPQLRGPFQKKKKKLAAKT